MLSSVKDTSSSAFPPQKGPLFGSAGPLRAFSLAPSAVLIAGRGSPPAWMWAALDRRLIWLSSGKSELPSVGSVNRPAITKILDFDRGCSSVLWWKTSGPCFHLSVYICGCPWPPKVTCSLVLFHWRAPARLGSAQLGLFLFSPSGTKSTNSEIFSSVIYILYIFSSVSSHLAKNTIYDTNNNMI